MYRFYNIEQTMLEMTPDLGEVGAGSVVSESGLDGLEKPCKRKTVHDSVKHALPQIFL